jgi:hypothetical protein
MNNIIFLKTHSHKKLDPHHLQKDSFSFHLEFQKTGTITSPFLSFHHVMTGGWIGLGGQSQQPLDGHDMVIGFGRVT